MLEVECLQLYLTLAFHLFQLIPFINHLFLQILLLFPFEPYGLIKEIIPLSY